MTKIPLLNRIRKGDRLNNTLRPPRWMESNASDRAEWRKHLDLMLQLYLQESRLACFNIDPIAKHYFVDNPKEYWDLTELRGLHPPEAACWMEYVFPGKIHSEIGDQDASEFGRIDTGWLILHSDKTDAVFAPLEGPPENTATILILQRFEYFQLCGEYVTGPDGMWALALDPAGCVLSKPCLHTWAPKERVAPMLDFCQTGLDIPLLACSNAEIAAERQTVIAGRD